MTLEIKVASKRVQQVLSATPAELFKAQVEAGKRVGDRYLAHHRARRMRGGIGVRGTAKGIRTHFKRDVTGTNLGNMVLTMGTKSRVAIEHERGGTLTPGKRSALLIPFSKFSRQRQKTFRALAKAGKLIVIRARDGRAYLARPTTSRKQFQAQFAKQENLVAHLQRTVRLKPRLGFHAEWPGYIPKAMQIFKAAVPAAINAARRKAGAVGT